MTVDWHSERVGRTRGAAIAGALAIGFGAATQTGTALLLGIPIVGYVLLNRLDTGTSPEIECDRELDQHHPLPGRDVTVTVTVRNAGTDDVPDLRLVDGVPDSLAVVDGSPRAGLSIPAGDSASFSYTVRARRGEHRFERLTAISRNLTGSVRSRADVPIESTVHCRVRADSYGLEDRASAIAGAMDTAKGGSGVEFHSLREYDTSDPASRIDWRRLAAGGDLTTIQYRETNAAFVQFVLDRRSTIDRSFSASEMTHRENTTYAAELLTEMLVENNHYVGLSSYGKKRNHILPANGDDQWLRLQRVFEEMTSIGDGSAPAPRRTRDDPTSVADELVALLPSYTQFTLVSPLFDDTFVDYARRLQAHDRAVIVVSPRPSTVRTNGQRIMLSERALRIDELRRHDVTVLDWDTDDPLPFFLERRFGVTA